MANKPIVPTKNKREKVDDVPVEARVFTISRWNPKNKEDGTGTTDQVDYVELCKVFTPFARWGEASTTLPKKKSSTFSCFIDGKLVHMQAQRVV